MNEIVNKSKPFVIPEHTSAWNIHENIDLDYRRDIETLSDTTLDTVAYDINKKMVRVGQNPDNWYDLGRRYGFDIEDWAAWTDPIVDTIEDGRETIWVRDMEHFATEILYAALPGKPEYRRCPDIVGRLREEK